MKINDILNNNENNNLLKEWLEFRQDILANLDKDDKVYLLNYDDYCEKILKHTDKDYYKYISKKLDFLYDDFMNYTAHWNDKYYMAGFSDAIKLIISGLKLE